MIPTLAIPSVVLRTEIKLEWYFEDENSLRARIFAGEGVGWITMRLKETVSENEELFVGFSVLLQEAAGLGRLFSYSSGHHESWARDWRVFLSSSASLATTHGDTFYSVSRYAFVIVICYAIFLIWVWRSSVWRCVVNGIQV